MSYYQFIAPGWSEVQWKSHYLLIISRLNFDLPVRLIIMPNALNDTQWTKKQWNALVLYGLESCQYLDQQPPILAKSIDWETVNKQLRQNTHQLNHICHWQNKQHFKAWLPVVKDQDQLFIYGAMNHNDLTYIFSQWPNDDIHIVFNKLHPHMANDTQRHWQQLLQQRNIPLSWN